MSINTKNYMRQGGKEWHIGGGLIIDPAGQFAPFSLRKNTYYVDSTVTASGAGKSWATAFKTIAEAVAVAVSGDTIFIYSGFGNTNQFNEAVTVTSLAGIRFIGGGTSPDQAVWTAPDTTAPCVTFAASPNFSIENIKLRPPLGNAAISLIGASNWGRIRGNRLQGKAGSYYGILSDGSQNDVNISDNDFLYINTLTYGTAIKSTGVADLSGLNIQGNKFHSNLNHIVAPMKQSVIDGNIFAAGGLAADGSYSGTLTVLGIDIHGAASGYNEVTRNILGGLYHQAHYYGGVGDEWVGNFCKDRTHATQVDATTGFSILAPAA